MDNTVGRQLCISQIQKELICGCLLGDGRLEARSKAQSARLRIHHGWKQKDLVFWKYKLLKNLVSCPPRKIKCWENPKNGEKYYSWYFHTKTIPELKDIYKLFYSNGKKILPRNTADLLTPISLSVWVMDDGCNSNGSIVLNTQNFSLSDHSRLKRIFQERFGILSTINKDRDEFRLRLNKDNADKLIRMISGNIIPSMKYKLSP